MRSQKSAIGLPLGLFLVIALTSAFSRAQQKSDLFETVTQAVPPVYPIDLMAALKLAGARNLDVQTARQKLIEAQANYASARLQFFPWFTPGAGYRRHEERTQDVVGRLLDTDKQSYLLGATVTAQWDLGDAIYKTLALKQQAAAAGHALEAQRQASVLAAAHGYFDLLLAQALVGVNDEAVRISQSYLDQVHQAVEIGVAFKGDEWRVQAQTERNRLARQQALEQSRLAASRLAELLHLDPQVLLKANEAEMIPITLNETIAPLESLVQTSLLNRAESKQSQALLRAAEASRDGVVVGPWIPSIGAQAFLGGLGGGVGDEFGRFGPSRDYAVTLGWRIGPGGLFDSSRKQSADARLQMARLSQEKLRDGIVQQVVAAATCVESARRQIDFAERALKASAAALQLSQERKQFAVGAVLEYIVAEQELTRARGDYLRAIIDLNKARYTLDQAMGKL